MPLIHSGSDEARSRNIATEIEAGKPRAQAVAIAYSVQRRAKGEPEEVGKGGDVVMSQKEYLTEHARLIAALKSPDRKDDLEEAGRQEEEVEERTGQEVGKAEHNHNPTEGQKRAGNYAKTHWRMHGMDVTIENLAGSQRSGVGEDGKPWSVTMPYHYGYIRGTEGADGDHLDVAVGPLHDRGTEAHIINQKNPKTGAFDEHKVFIGFPSREAAITAFHLGRSDDPKNAMGPVITVPVDELRRWVDEGNLKEQAVLKAEAPAGPKGHVKAHYRVVNGKVAYVHDYNKEVHGDHPQATLQQRTAMKQTKHGWTIQATDAEDNDAVKAAMGKAGVSPTHSQHTGATHFGVKKAVFQHHFATEEEAKKVHEALGEAMHPGVGPDKGPQPGPDKGAPEPAPAESEHEKALKMAQDGVEDIAHADVLEKTIGKKALLAIVAGWKSGATGLTDHAVAVLESAAAAAKPFLGPLQPGINPEEAGAAYLAVNMFEKERAELLTAARAGFKLLGEAEPAVIFAPLTGKLILAAGQFEEGVNKLWDLSATAEGASREALGYADPEAYGGKIKALKLRRAYYEAAGRIMEADAAAKQVVAEQAKQAEAQKMKDYMSLDPEDLMTTHAGTPDAKNAFKLATLAFQARAQASKNLGNTEASDVWMTKAKAAAAVALSLN